MMLRLDINNTRLAGLFLAWIALTCGCRSLTDGDLPELALPVQVDAALRGSAGDFARTHLELEPPDGSPEETSRWYYSERRAILPVEERKPWPLTLEQTMRMALSTSKVIRRIGGAVVDAPEGVSTIFDPALAETDPVWGTAAALSSFDAQFGTQMFFGGNEQRLKNTIAGDGTREPRIVSGLHNTSLSKTTATGTQFSFGQRTTYDRDNSPLNLFDGSHTAGLRGEVRHPLRQGGGLAFNRIAGPTAPLGEYRGILVARLRRDIGITDFQSSIRNMLLEVERAYWELYFAYRELDARIKARDSSLEVWRAVQARFENGETDGEQEALARERYFAAGVEVENALRGRPVGTASRRTPTVGIHGFQGGLLAAERRLRYLVGLPVYDGKRIRPVDEPVRAQVVFDRTDSLQQAFQQRIEIRRQRLRVRQRELELIAARNFLKPRIDLVGSYRLHGFGDNLFGSGGGAAGSGAFGGLFQADLQDWSLGLEWTAPVGFRRAHAAVRHAELQVARTRAMLREQQHQIAHELDAAFGELQRAYSVNRVNYNRRVAARDRASAVQAKYQVGKLALEFVEEAYRRQADSEIEFARSLVDYSLALAGIHYSRGTYLDFIGVHLTESPTAFGRSADGPEAPVGPLSVTRLLQPVESRSNERSNEQSKERSNEQSEKTSSSVSVPPTQRDRAASSDARDVPNPPLP